MGKTNRNKVYQKKKEEAPNCQQIIMNTFGKENFTTVQSAKVDFHFGFGYGYKTEAQVFGIPPGKKDPDVIYAETFSKQSNCSKALKEAVRNLYSILKEKRMVN